MNLKTLGLLSLLVSGFGIVSQPATAQAGNEVIPVNFPPSSFSGRQFVDNKGCVFVRAGFDGNVTWVPRVTRSRQQICGQKPTFGTVREAAAPAAAPQIAPRVEMPVVAPTPAPQPVRTARVAPQPAPKPVQRVVRAAPASKPVEAEPPRVLRRVPVAPQAQVRATKPLAVPTYGACANGVRTRTFQGKTLQVRCGPQTSPHVTIVRRGEAPTAGKNVYYNKTWNDSSLDPKTRIIPRHIYEGRDTSPLYVPAGYKPAWEDDRLNPYRALQTVEGYRMSQQVWTHSVPRESVLTARKRFIHDHDPIIAYQADPATYYLNERRYITPPLHYVPWR